MIVVFTLELETTHPYDILSYPSTPENLKSHMDQSCLCMCN